MSDFQEYITLARLVLIALVAFIFLIKIILLLIVEKDRNPVTFFYYSTVDLRMTTSKRLKRWRKRQNFLTVCLSVSLIFLLLAFLVHALLWG